MDELSEKILAILDRDCDSGTMSRVNALRDGKYLSGVQKELKLDDDNEFQLAVEEAYSFFDKLHDDIPAKFFLFGGDYGGERPSEGFQEFTIHATKETYSSFENFKQLVKYYLENYCWDSYSQQTEDIVVGLPKCFQTYTMPSDDLIEKWYAEMKANFEERNVE